jgi:hypothetical protein
MRSLPSIYNYVVQRAAPLVVVVFARTTSSGQTLEAQRQQQ